jgi:hypothetical protein
MVAEASGPNCIPNGILNIYTKLAVTFPTSVVVSPTTRWNDIQSEARKVLTLLQLTTRYKSNTEQNRQQKSEPHYMSKQEAEWKAEWKYTG